MLHHFCNADSGTLTVYTQIYLEYVRERSICANCKNHKVSVKIQYVYVFGIPPVTCTVILTRQDKRQFRKRHLKPGSLTEESPSLVAL